MYKIQINPEALHMLQTHPVVTTATALASIIGTRLIASAILRATRGNSQPRRTPRPTETLTGRKALDALEHMTKNQKQ